MSKGICRLIPIRISSTIGITIRRLRSNATGRVHVPNGTECHGRPLTVSSQSRPRRPTHLDQQFRPNAPLGPLDVAGIFGCDNGRHAIWDSVVVDVVLVVVVCLL